jgi:hypothetical protein
MREERFETVFVREREKDERKGNKTENEKGEKRGHKNAWKETLQRHTPNVRSSTNSSNFYCKSSFEDKTKGD